MYLHGKRFQTSVMANDQHHRVAASECSILENGTGGHSGACDCYTAAEQRWVYP